MIEGYFIQFTAGKNGGISIIERTKAKGGQYKNTVCVQLLAKNYPAAALTPKNERRFWVSYDDGQILMGQGSIGENILLMYQDITPPAVIDAINLTVDEATVQNLAIAPPVSLGQASNVESYDKPKINIKDFSTSSMTLLLPFEYQFNQEEEAVTIYDGILNKGPDRIAGTLEKGTFYKFNFQINPDGGYEMEWLNQPDNPTQQKVQKALLIADAEQARLQSKIDLMAKEGAIAKQEKEAEAQRKTNTGEQIASGARLVAETLGGIPGIGTMAATAATFGAQAATQIYGAMAADINLDAAKIELQAQKRGLEVEAKAKELEYQAKLLQGAAAVAFTGNDGYFLKDKLTPTQIQEGQISQDIIDLEPQIAAKLDQIEQQVSPENLIWRITQAQNMVYLIKHFYPIRKEEMRDRIWSDLTALYKEGSTAADAQQELQDLLFLAYNNSFLTGMDADAPTLRKTWINNIRKVATKALTNPNEDFMLCNCFGEYVALGKLPKEGAGLITFEAMGENDLLIGFTKSKDKPIRNSAEELYEVGIGCWQNTKHVIRAENLGKSIVEVSTDDAPDSQLPAQEFQKYWVNINQGHVAAGIGDPGTNTFISWQDPYPTPKLNYIMASAWNAPITIKNIKIAAALNLTGIPETSGAKVLTDPATIGGVNPQTTDAMELAKIEDESNAEIQSIATPTVPEPTAPVEEEIAQEKPVSEDEVMAEV